MLNRCKGSRSAPLRAWTWRSTCASVPRAYLGSRGKMRIRGILAMLAVASTVSVARADVVRPPQFVVMAFDGGINLQRGQELAYFSAAMKRDGKPVHFTIFVSGIAFVED